MNYLFDTCVLSEVQKKNPHPRVVDWIQDIDDHRIYISCITMGEIKRGILAVGDGTRRTRLIRWYEDELLTRFGDHILDIDTRVMERWGEAMAALDRMGTSMPLMDSLIGATALHKRLALVTRNRRDFAPLGVVLVDPWEEEAPSGDAEPIPYTTAPPTTTDLS